jgi:hypothetical protein
MSPIQERNPQAAVANRSGQLGVYRVIVTGIDMTKVGQPNNDPKGMANTVDTFGHLRQIGMSMVVGSGAIPQVGETWIINQALGSWTFLSRQVPDTPIVYSFYSLAEGLEDLGLIDYQGPAAPPVPFKNVNTVAQNLAATANITTYAPLPTPMVSNVVVTAGNWLCLFVITVYINTTSNNTEVALAMNVSGGTNIPAGSRTEDRLHVLAKSPIGSSINQVVWAVVNPGSNRFEVQHSGQACTISDLAFSFIPLLLLPVGFTLNV